MASRQARANAVARATQAGGVATLLQPEYATRVAANAVPPTPPEYVAVLINPNTELSRDSGNQRPSILVQAGQQGARKAPVRARPGMKKIREEAK